MELICLRIGSCEHGNEPLGATKDLEIINSCVIIGCKNVHGETVSCISVLLLCTETLYHASLCFCCAWRRYIKRFCVSAVHGDAVSSASVFLLCMKTLYHASVFLLCMVTLYHASLCF
jgi:hypothetical protein